MTIRVALNHRSSYTFDRPVVVSPHLIRLRPAPHCRTPITAYSLRIAPDDHFINWQQDPQGNYVARLVFPEKLSALEVEVDVIAEMTAINPFDFFLEPEAEHVPVRLPGSAAERVGTVPAHRTGGSETGRVLEFGRSFQTQDDRLSRRSELPASTGRGICDSPGTGRANMRRNVDAGHRVLSRFGLVVGADATESGDGGPVRLGILDSIGRRPETAGRARRDRRRISRICTPGARSTCRGRAGSDWTRRRACWPAKGTFPWPVLRNPPARRRSPGPRKSVKRNSTTPCPSRAFTKTRE